MPENRAISVADPGPLGLAAFALTTFLLSLSNAGILAGTGPNIVIPVALLYGGAVQVAAGMFEFFNRNTFGATAFASYGAFWMAYAGVFLFPGVASALGPNSVPFFLLGWTIFTFYMMVGSLRLNGALTTTFILLFLAFVALTIGAFGHAELTKIGGGLGILTAIAAWYTSAAGILNGVYGRVVLPVGPYQTSARAAAAAAMETD